MHSPGPANRDPSPLAPAPLFLRLDRFRLAAWFGLVGGYLDLAGCSWRRMGFTRRSISSRGDSSLGGPAGAPDGDDGAGVAVAGVDRLRPVWCWSWSPPGCSRPWGSGGRCSGSPCPARRACCWRPAGAVIGRFVARLGPRPQAGRRGLAGLGGLLAIVAVSMASIVEAPHPGCLPPPERGPQRPSAGHGHRPPESLSLYGYPRDTTPNSLAGRRRGVRFDRAWRRPRGPSPRTAPSSPANGPTSSIAALARPRPACPPWPIPGRAGYLTAGFAANTNNCSYETGLDRGFAHYEDYPLSPRVILARRRPGVGSSGLC